MFCLIPKIVQMCNSLCKMFFLGPPQDRYFLLACRQLVTMVYGGVHWSGVSVGEMEESQGGVLQQGPNIPFDCHLSGLIGGVLGGRPGGWVVWGKVGETMCHVTITCICHSLNSSPIAQTLGMV